MRTDLSPVTDVQVCSSFAYVSGPGTGYHGDPAVVSIDMGNKRVFKRYLGHKAPVLLSRVSDHKYLWSGASDAAVHCTLLRSGTVVIQLRAYPLQFLAALLATAASFVQLLSIPFVYDTTAFHDVGASHVALALASMLTLRYAGTCVFPAVICDTEGRYRLRRHVSLEECSRGSTDTCDDRGGPFALRQARDQSVGDCSCRWKTPRCQASSHPATPGLGAGVATHYSGVHASDQSVAQSHQV